MIVIFLSIKLLLLFLVCFCTLAGQSPAVEPSPQELKKFLMALDRQCKNYGWKDIRLTGIKFFHIHEDINVQ